MKTDTRVAPGWQFASDNTAGICPEAWAAMQAANSGYAASYGADAWTQRACDADPRLFERQTAQVFSCSTAPRPMRCRSRTGPQLPRHRLPRVRARAVR